MKSVFTSLFCALLFAPGSAPGDSPTPTPTPTPASAGQQANIVHLAQGAPLFFTPAPSGKAGEEVRVVARALTDGQLSPAEDAKLWRDKTAAVWKYAGKVNLAIDLGKLCNVDEVAIRLLGGDEPGGGQAKSFPGEVELLVSKDGEHYGKVANFSRWRRGDTERFGIPTEEGKSWVHLLRFRDLAVQARWVGLRIYSSGLSATDEVFVYGSAADAGGERSNKTLPDGFSMRWPQIYFHKPSLTVAEGIPLPVPVGARIPTEAAGAPLHVEFDLPKGVELRSCDFTPLEMKSHAPQELPAGGKRYRFEVRSGVLNSTKDSRKEFFRLYLEAGNGTSEATRTALTYRFGSGESWQSPDMSLPIEITRLARAPRLKKLMMALGWWRLSETLQWPDALESFEKIGLNTVSDTMPGPARYAPEGREMQLLEQARQRGFFISCVDMPIHRMLNRHPAESELYCQFEDGSVGRTFCPSYRGKFWEEELKRFANMFSDLKPDFAAQDIELWRYADQLDFDFSDAAKEHRKCTRCEADFHHSPEQQSTSQWRQAKGRELWSQLLKAAREGHGGKPFRIGGYNFRPKQVYQRVWNFDRLHREQLLDHAQPANYGLLYPAHLESIGDRVRQDKERGVDVMPWLTPGDAGALPGELFLWSILEAYANGASGIWFYSNRVWDAEAFLAMNRAAHALAPVETIIAEGRLIGDAAQTQGPGRVSGMRRGAEMVLLVADYREATEGNVALALQLGAPSRIVDLLNGEELFANLKSGSHTVAVPLEKGAARLLRVIPSSPIAGGNSSTPKY